MATIAAPNLPTASGLSFFLGLYDTGGGNYSLRRVSTADVALAVTSESGYVRAQPDLSNFYFGEDAGNLSASGENNTSTGKEALLAITSGDNNTVGGFQAGTDITSGNRNALFGVLAGASLTSANDNVAVGYNTLVASLTGGNNVAIGANALSTYLLSEAVAVGSGALLNATGLNNTAVGTSAGGSITTGASGVYVGYSAGTNASQPAGANSVVCIGNGTYAASDCIVIGAGAGSATEAKIVLGTTSQDEVLIFGRSFYKAPVAANRNYFFGPAGNNTLTSASACIGVGEFALMSVSTGAANTAVGDYALSALTTSSGNTAVGNSALKNAVTPTDCTAIGSQALEALTSGTGATAVGKLSFATTTGGNNNTGIGDSTGRYTTSGARNCAMGYRSFEGNTTGSDNLSIGFGAMLERQGGDGNIALGSGAMGGSSVTALGSYNIAIGFDAGKSLRGSADDNIFIGRDAGDHASQGDAVDNSIAIGKDAYTTASHQMVLGNTSHTAFILEGATSIKLGRDVAAPAARTIAMQSVVAGTSNTAGVNLTIAGSQGTGTGAGGAIIFQYAAAGGAGSSQNSLSNVMTISSQVTLQANLTLAKAAPLVYMNADSGTNPEIRFAENGTSYWFIYNENSTDRIYVTDASGDGVYIAQNATSWTSTSDKRLKENWSPISVLASIAANENVSFIGSFDWRHTGNRAVGALAQDIHKVFPDMVVVGSDGDLPADAGPTHADAWGLNKDLAGLYALQGVKELLALNRAQAERIAQLEEKVTLLQAA